MARPITLSPETRRALLLAAVHRCWDDGVSINKHNLRARGARGDHRRNRLLLGWLREAGLIDDAIWYMGREAKQRRKEERERGELPKIVRKLGPDHHNERRTPGPSARPRRRHSIELIRTAYWRAWPVRRDWYRRAEA